VRPPPGVYAATCGPRLAWQARSVKVVFNAELWLWDARRTETWTFVSLPASESEEIRDLAGGLRRGFGSVRVRATIGNSTWTTSIFPASQAGYVLPVKRPIRVAEALDVGDMATVTVELIGFTLRRPIRVAVSRTRSRVSPAAAQVTVRCQAFRGG
jgi:hypothetical protein